MSSNARVIPVRYDQTAIRSDADIRGSKPLIAGTVENVVDLRFVTGTVRGNCVAADNVRTGVTMNQLVLVLRWQGITFVDQNSSR